MINVLFKLINALKIIVEICDVTLMFKGMINCSVIGIRLGLACTLAEFSLRSSTA